MVVSALAPALLSSSAGERVEAASLSSAAPPLVLIIAVDQLRRDRLHSGLPGGLGRILRSGRVYERAALAHAHTETCPGHASISTGRHPGPIGITSNAFVERSTLQLRYCVDDPDPNAATFGSDLGRSPRNLRATTLGDWIKQQHPDARSFAVSAKDRSAIMLGGQNPNGVYWLDWKGQRGSFTTSRYYADVLPEWLSSWTREKILEGLPDRWEHPTGDPPNGLRHDAFVGEAPQFSPRSPHPLPGSLPSGEVPPPSDRASMMMQSLASLYFSPFVDSVTLRFARELVEREDLGKRWVPELLAISLSGTDLVGHLYGPRSQEADDALVRLDRDLAHFLDFLEARVGSRRLLIALTSDHGVLPLPEWLAVEGRATCPVASGRVNANLLYAGLDAELVKRFGAPPSPEAGPAVVAPPPGWLVREGFRLTVNRPLASARGVDPKAIVAAASAFLALQPGVERPWTPDAFAGASGEKAALYRNSHDAERGGDLIIEPTAGCLFVNESVGTTHGSPHAYDRDVPLVITGPGIEAGSDLSPAATVDLAPTLAWILGVATPANLDGRPLPLGR